MNRAMIICDIQDPCILKEVEAFLLGYWPGAHRLVPGVLEGFYYKEIQGPFHTHADTFEYKLHEKLSRPLPPGSKIYQVSADVYLSEKRTGKSLCPVCNEFSPYYQHLGMLQKEVFYQCEGDQSRRIHQAIHGS